MHEEIKKKIKDRMNKTIDSLNDEFKKIRSGRANASLVEGLMVEYYGNRLPLKQIAGISVPEPRLIVIQPWDKGALPFIDKAFHKSDLMLNPNNDGKVIHISIPSLTEERRKDLVKVAKAYGAEAMRITKAEEVKKALKESLKIKDRPVLMDFMVAKEENVFPFVPPGQAINEMLID